MFLFFSVLINLLFSFILLFVRSSRSRVLLDHMFMFIFCSIFIFFYLIEYLYTPLQGRPSLLRGALCAGLYDVKCRYERIFTVSAKIQHSKLKESPQIPS